MLTQKECILTRILGCGSADLDMLEDINYDLDDILDELKANDCLSLHGIFSSVFEKRIEDIKDMVMDKLTELKESLEEAEDENEQKELQDQIDDLQDLEPESDINYYLNFQDTHIYLSKNSEIYRKYFGVDADSKYGLSGVENNMGFEFEY